MRDAEWRDFFSQRSHEAWHFMDDSTLPFDRVVRIGLRQTWPKADRPSVIPIRTMDEFQNPPLAGDYYVDSLNSALELLDDSDLFPASLAPQQYLLLSVNLDALPESLDDPRLRLLGYDLSDGDHDNRSLLQDAGFWCNELQPIYKRRNEHQLLSWDDARRAQALFQAAWPGIESFIVWALYEVSLGSEQDLG